MPSAFQFRDSHGRWTRSRSKTVTVWSRATGEKVYGARAEKVRKRDKPKRRRKPKPKPQATIPRPARIPAGYRNQPFSAFLKPIPSTGLKEKIDRIFILCEYTHAKYESVGGAIVLPELVGSGWTGKEAREFSDERLLWMLDLKPLASARTKILGMFGLRAPEKRKKIMRRLRRIRPVSFRGLGGTPAPAPAPAPVMKGKKAKKAKKRRK